MPKNPVETPQGRDVKKKLKCGCVKTFPQPGPSNGESIWCNFHRGMRTVLYTETYDWKMKCSDCTYARTADGTLKAGTMAAGHLKRKPGHHITVTMPNGEVDTVYGAKEQGQIEIGEIPF